MLRILEGSGQTGEQWGKMRSLSHHHPSLFPLLCRLLSTFQWSAHQCCSAILCFMGSLFRLFFFFLLFSFSQLIQPRLLIWPATSIYWSCEWVATGLLWSSWDISTAVKTLGKVDLWRVEEFQGLLFQEACHFRASASLCPSEGASCPFPASDWEWVWPEPREARKR